MPKQQNKICRETISDLLRREKQKETKMGHPTSTYCTVYSMCTFALKLRGILHCQPIVVRAYLHYKPYVQTLYCKPFVLQGRNLDCTPSSKICVPTSVQIYVLQINEQITPQAPTCVHITIHMCNHSLLNYTHTPFHCTHTRGIIHTLLEKK